MARLYRVIVPVNDVEAARVFYERVLGAAGRRVSPGRHYFDCEGTILACFDPQVDGDGYVVGPLGEIARRPWGEESFYALDPFGNTLCFVSRDSVFTG
jgi:catechol 2,3-dioxygenase-like lactoylglutathione lyase family enzyme